MPEWTFDQRIRFTLQLAVGKALKVVGFKQLITETQEERMADAIADHLKLANYRIEEGRPAQTFGELLRGPGERE